MPGDACMGLCRMEVEVENCSGFAAEPEQRGKGFALLCNPFKNLW